MGNDTNPTHGDVQERPSHLETTNPSPPQESHHLQAQLSHLKDLQATLPTQPYSVPLRLRLGAAYQSLGYPDLAAGDAYKALLLVDEIGEEGEYHDEALDAARDDLLRRAADAGALDAGTGSTDASSLLHERCVCRAGLDVSQGLAEETVVQWAKECWAKTAYDLLITCLTDCGCLRSAHNYIVQAVRSLADGSALFERHRETLNQALRSYFESRDETFEDAHVDEYPDRGMVRRELYPWNDHEPDRFSPESIGFLNDEMRAVAPKLEVRVTELPVLTPGGAAPGVAESSDRQTATVKQLGVFAKEDIAPGESVLQEKSLLTAVARLHESYCDACSLALPDARSAAEESTAPIVCEDCDEAFFCSEQCLELAQSNYHPAICGATLQTEKVTAAEAADSLYALLLVRALALAQTRDVDALDLKEVKYIWGDYTNANDTQRPHPARPTLDARGRPDDAFAHMPRTLPFSFTHHVTQPLHALSSSMDANIFTPTAAVPELWAVNTLYAKFRGTASAQQGRDPRRPEIAAVHPLWCLANHSCDPNVAWAWRGSMRFWARDQLVEWGRGGRGEGREPGLRAGDEVFSHYCDVRLPVRERREWAVGALGGGLYVSAVRGGGCRGVIE